MFPLPSDEQVHLEEPSFFEPDKFLEDLLVDCAPLEETDEAEKGVKKRQRKVGNKEKRNEGSSNNEFKKIMHRDIERQRRQEMSGLYASLRSLLPLEYIKGKRSTSDHMNQAVSYIKHMQKKIEEMKRKRENLERFSSEDRSSNTSDSANNVCLNVNVCKDGAEILISSGLNNEAAFPLSRVIADLLGKGLHVISYVSTRADECCLHKIHIEENDTTGVDVFELQERLTNDLWDANILHFPEPELVQENLLKHNPDLIETHY